MSYLLVPIHLDALFLSKEQQVMEAMADFSRLPYFDGNQFQNSDTPNVSDSILCDPLGQPNLVLKPGVHLHWALPDALAKGVHVDNRLLFPAVPNRWLIIRRVQGVVQQRWVVESDYLHPEGVKPQTGATISYTPGEGEYQPFRYLGRSLTWDNWHQGDRQGEYLKVLTAVGDKDSIANLDIVKTMFAAFYPNAGNVFGFHDDSDARGIIPSGLEYEVIGWYSNAAQDALKSWLDKQGDTSQETLLASLQSDFKWTFDDEDESFPQQIICYAKLTFNKSGAISNPDLSQHSLPNITVGNTACEALSAYLAHTINPTQQSILEEQLEALEFCERLERQALDVGFKFKEARHTQGFNSSPGATIYTIKSEKPPKTQIESESTQITSAGIPELASLPIELAQELDELNRRVQNYFRTYQQVQYQRQQIFANWCKYLFSAYGDGEQNAWPESSSILRFIQKFDIPAFNVATQKLEALKQESDLALQNLTKKLAAFNQIQGKNFSLETSPAPGYYRPLEPVILMTGDVAKSTHRHGQDGRLRSDGLLHCQLLTEKIDLVDFSEKTFSAIASRINKIDADCSVGISNWEQQPWHPLLLAWKVEFFPDSKTEDLTSFCVAERYSSNVINYHYDLPANSCDLVKKDGRVCTQGTNVYKGFSVLSAHAGIKFRLRLASYLNRKLELNESYPQSYLDREIASLKTKYEQEKQFSSDKAKAQDPVYTALQAYELLGNTNSLSQALSGFNDALLTCHQAMQLEVKDPFADRNTKPLVEQIRQAIGDSGVGLAPYPNDFNALRAGAMQIVSLRLIDNFGQVLDLRDLNLLNARSILTSELLKSSYSSHPVYLPPRLAQPARLNFCWLAARDGEREVGVHPAMTPVCGWLMPNNLDRSLMVYDGEGKGLGLIDGNARWQPMPGSNYSRVDDISNIYLQRVVRFILNQGVNFLEPFHGAVENALENIAPESFATHEALALLVGRPLAVVRASIDLELAGLPASSQAEIALGEAMESGSYSDGGISDINFPIRIGEYHQMNDGLVGYWPEDETGNLSGDSFFAPQSQQVGSTNIRTHADGDVNIMQSINGAPQTMTLLIDPRGAIHATSGILPTQALEIHPEHYAQALKNIQAVFSTSPLLMEQGKTEIPLPKQPGYIWSWVTQQNGTWTETNDIKTVKLNATFSGKQTIQGGWLKLSLREDSVEESS